MPWLFFGCAAATRSERRIDPGGGVRTLLAAPPPKQHSHTNPASYAGYMSRRNTVFQTVVDSAEGPGGRPATLLIFRPN